jgi:hypothetical protein
MAAADGAAAREGQPRQVAVANRTRADDHDLHHIRHHHIARPVTELGSKILIADEPP